MGARTKPGTPTRGRQHRAPAIPRDRRGHRIGTIAAQRALLDTPRLIG